MIVALKRGPQILHSLKWGQMGTPQFRDPLPPFLISGQVRQVRAARARGCFGRDNGTENGNYFSGFGIYIGIMEKKMETTML